ncbi:hypothetical protein HHK36_022176 [Tetracentron sinense]|uniref:Uncharacterized protein n=1 Tax=Tetracentron sinense TaxID=13715 RepID=A0A834YSE6_TETSI|nr:hypothetical protein HHK36_022176 [Tetracentron sinense]
MKKISDLTIFNIVSESRSLNQDQLGDVGTNGIGLKQVGSIHRTSSVVSSWRRHLLSFSLGASTQVEDDSESETVSQVADIGDRALHSNRYSESCSLRFTVDNEIENGVAPIVENALVQSSNIMSPVSPLPLEIISPLSTDAILIVQSVQTLVFQVIYMGIHLTIKPGCKYADSDVIGAQKLFLIVAVVAID